MASITITTTTISKITNPIFFVSNVDGKGGELWYFYREIKALMKSSSDEIDIITSHGSFLLKFNKGGVDILFKNYKNNLREWKVPFLETENVIASLINVVMLKKEKKSILISYGSSSWVKIESEFPEYIDQKLAEIKKSLKVSM